MVTRYDLVKGKLHDLTELVNNLINEGWEPVGSPVIVNNSNLFVQAMIICEKPIRKKRAKQRQDEQLNS